MRTREGVRLLRDRLLPDGGCNYGNTTVLGQTLSPAHAADRRWRFWRCLAKQITTAESRGRSIICRRRNQRETAAASLAYAIWALVDTDGHRRIPRPTGWPPRRSVVRRSNSPHRHGPVATGERGSAVRRLVAAVTFEPCLAKPMSLTS